MISAFEDFKIKLHNDYVHKVSAFSRWCWHVIDDTSILTKKELERYFEFLQDEYPNAKVNKFKMFTREFELLKICWLIKNFDSSKTSIFYNFIKDTQIEQHTIEDGNHTLAACAYLKYSPWITVNLSNARVINQLIKDKIIIDCNCTLRNKSVIGRNIVSFSKRQTYSFIFNEQCLSVDKVDTNNLEISYVYNEYGYVGFTSDFPVTVKNKVIDCNPDEKLYVFLQEMEKATGNPFTDLYEQCKVRYERAQNGNNRCN
jgi:hypothetical protein